jgi:KUP system potassium uptake protein
VEGGWLPLAIAAGVGLVMATWIRGARLVQKEFRKNEAELDWLIKKLEAKPPFRVSGTAVFLTPDVNSAPTSLMHNLKHNRILHERNIVLSIKTNDVPRVPRRERLEIDRSNEKFIKITAHYGFMETPSIPKIFNQCRRKSFNVDLGATSFFVSRRVLRPSSKSEMPLWQDMLFIALTHGAEDATAYFQIPTDRVVEVGTQIAV